MGRVLSKNVSLRVAKEASVGTLPGSPAWKLLEPNVVNQFGAVIDTTERNPISAGRGRRKGTVTDLDSSVEFEADLTLDTLLDSGFAEGFVFATAVGGERVQSGALYQNARVTSTSAYAHDALSAALAQGTLVFGRGFPTAANNGLKLVDASSTTTQTNIAGSTLVVETPGNTQNASIEVAGFRAATSDLAITVSAGVATLASTLLDFTTLSLTVGQFIHVGGLTAANQFSAGVGYGRITTLSANSMTLDKLTGTLATDAGTGETVDLLFGRFIRDVPTSSADFLEQYFQFEAAFPGLDNPSGDMYEYAEGNLCNELTFNMPLSNKATVNVGFVGTDTEVPTATRKTNAANAARPVMTEALNTSADIARLRIAQLDETGLTTCFKSLTITLRNGAEPEKCLGTLGATFMNIGDFEVEVEAQVLFTNADVVTAIRTNETVAFDAILRNNDGAIALDIPSMTLGGGDKEFPANQSVLLNTTGSAFEDATLGYSVSISTFPVVP